jgi:hypothetical protein
MSSTDSTEFEDSSFQEYFKEEIEKQNFSLVLDHVQSLKSAGRQQYLTWLKVIYEHSVSLYFFEFAQSLFKLYPELLTHQYFLDPLNDDQLNIAASAGNLVFLKFLLNAVGVSPRVLHTSGFNLFENAVRSNQLETAKFIREELGICSHHEDIVLRAAKYGHLSMFKFLVEEVNIVIRHRNTCLHNTVKSGKVELLTYLYDFMRIRTVEDLAVVELAIYQACQTGSLSFLETLLKFEFKVVVKHIQPYNEANHFRYSLFLSLCYAAKRGFLEVIQFVYEVFKVDLATADPNSPLACYSEMLKCAVEGGHKELLRYLLEEVHLDPLLLPCQQLDSLLLTILNSDADDLVKQQMLQTVLPFESQENYARVLEQTTDEQGLLLGRSKRKKLTVSHPHKTLS